ncbi:MAG: AmmeMemoRadiSam system protein A [Sphaerochaetaceae bacterium]|jgi:AmmeMemoRadiSam system protein A|nr:AmmeMemoRadiSam system protein A [Sphaerochaetaceae bacterium]MDX9938749.1 AmmeMemoRadiSam system protein A [Sphaerochaetaceae bacterium]
METRHKRLLLAIARESIMESLTGRYPKTLAEVESQDPVELAGEEGAFVTLKRRKVPNGAPGSLRGCIGNIQGKKPLYRLVHRLAKESAFSDPRFPKVTLGELQGLKIEISVLTVPRLVEGPHMIVVGRDGVLLTCGWHRSVFLPQVATEQGWDRETMLNHLAMKAGLDPDAWRGSDCRFEVFQAEIFEEE